MAWMQNREYRSEGSKILMKGGQKVGRIREHKGSTEATPTQGYEAWGSLMTAMVECKPTITWPLIYITYRFYNPCACKEGIISIPISQMSKVRLIDIGYLAGKGLSQHVNWDYWILKPCFLTSHHPEHQGHQQAMWERDSSSQMCWMPWSSLKTHGSRTSFPFPGSLQMNNSSVSRKVSKFICFKLLGVASRRNNSFPSYPQRPNAGNNLMSSCCRNKKMAKEIFFFDFSKNKKQNTLSFNRIVGKPNDCPSSPSRTLTRMHQWMKTREGRGGGGAGGYIWNGWKFRAQVFNLHIFWNNEI